MGQTRAVRNFAKVGDGAEIPNLIEIQRSSLTSGSCNSDLHPDKRDDSGLEALLREMFPIESYDGNMSLQYVNYELGKPRYTPDECRHLRLTYGMPFHIRVRLLRKEHEEIQEDRIYLGTLPDHDRRGRVHHQRGGAGHRLAVAPESRVWTSFKEQAEGDRALHGCRIIPERGSWIEMNVTKRDVLAVRIDQSSKIPATTFLRATSGIRPTKPSSRSSIETKIVRSSALKPEMYSVSTIVWLTRRGTRSPGQAGCQIGDAVTRMQNSDIKQVRVISQGRPTRCCSTRWPRTPASRTKRPC